MYLRTYDLERTNLNSLKYILNCIKLYTRFLHTLFILIGSFIQFNWNNFILYLKNNEPEKRLELIKNITRRLEKLNIVYIKIFQSLCLNDNILYDEEKDYLLKYTDNVPFLSSDIDYEIIDTLRAEYNIRVDVNEALNSGVISVVFKGIYKNKKVVIKIIKNDINRKITEAILVMEMFIKIISIIPYIRKLNLKKCILDNKELLLEQTNFIKEVSNLQIFKERNANNIEFVFPECYPEITNEHNNVIVMENIQGLTFNDIKYFDNSVKMEFGKLLTKFTLINILYNSAIHCDAHPGNIFFYINENTEDKPKYQVGYIDFGIVSFPSRENQNYYYIFFKEIQTEQNFNQLDKVIICIISEKDKYINLESSIKIELLEKIKKNLQDLASNDNMDFLFFIHLSHIINSYGFSFTKEFNHICLSIQIGISLVESLCQKQNTKKVQDEIMESFNNINKLIEI